ncbi:MAG: hypothetical protein HYU64_04765 [Armatimonadetes bacterium]|nr:hypothetical protein [Armatimonadota bacterium]
MSWKSCRTLIAKLCRRIAESGYDPEVIVGIGMGGIPLSLALRYSLGRIQWETLILRKYPEAPLVGSPPPPSPSLEGRGAVEGASHQGRGVVDGSPPQGGGQLPQDCGEGKLEILNCTTLHIEGKRILIVDDILGSGDTLALAKVVLARRSPLALRTAVLFADRGRLDQVDYWGMGVTVETQGPWRELMEIMC